MAIREIANDHRFSKSKTCAWWRNDALQERNSMTRNWENLICMRARSTQVLNHDYTRHALKVWKRCILEWNRVPQIWKSEPAAKEHSSYRIRRDQKGCWQSISNVLTKRRQSTYSKTDVPNKVSFWRPCNKNLQGFNSYARGIGKFSLKVLKRKLIRIRFYY